MRHPNICNIATIVAHNNSNVDAAIVVFLTTNVITIRQCKDKKIKKSLKHFFAFVTQR